jgi:hypothetical protein
VARGGAGGQAAREQALQLRGSAGLARARRSIPRIARRGVEISEKLSRHRWVIERSLVWLTGYRRLTLRYERSARLSAAILALAATLTRYKKLAT